MSKKETIELMKKDRFYMIYFWYDIFKIKKHKNLNFKQRCDLFDNIYK